MTDGTKTHLGALAFVGGSFGIVAVLHWLEVSLWGAFGYSIAAGALYWIGYQFTSGGIQGAKTRQAAKAHKREAAQRDQVAIIQRAHELYPEDEGRRAAYYLGATEDSL